MYNTRREDRIEVVLIIQFPCIHVTLDQGIGKKGTSSIQDFIELRSRNIKNLTHYIDSRLMSQCSFTPRGIRCSLNYQDLVEVDH